jgi:hypothetical protein
MRKRIVVFVALAGLTLAFGSAPEASPAQLAAETPIAALVGEGFLGQIVCWSCLGGAVASATPISGLVWNACADVCRIAM